MADQKTVKVTLTKPHTHARVEYQPGTVLALTEAQAERLIKAERATAYTGKDKAANEG